MSIRKAYKAANRCKPWTIQDVDYLTKNHNTMTYGEVSTVLGRSKLAVYQKAKRLGLKIKNNERIRRYKEYGSLGGKCKGRYVDRYGRIEKIRARKVISEAIRRGKLKRGECVICGTKNAQAHHNDYTKKYDIVWLCLKCHSAYHSDRLDILDK